MDFSSIDVFCHCIDNFGDAGVAYRFAKEFKLAHPGCRVRLFVDDVGTLRAIVDGIDPALPIQEYESLIYVNTLMLDDTLINTLGVADVMVEAFACHIPEPLMELAYDNSKLIVNLEYLSAEDWVEDYHLKESLLGRGPVRKFFFMPGFREATGGLIINSRLEKMRGDLAVRGDDNQLVGTIFTYERGFDTLISDLVDFGKETTLLVFGDKSRRGMSATLERLAGGAEVAGDRGRSPLRHQYRVYKNIRVVYMSFIDQHSYDTLLCLTDFNIVRGEDSLARAALSGKPFIWNAYIQDEKYQLVKVKALLQTMRPYFGDDDAFAAYSDLMLKFNDAPAESLSQITSERYDTFFKNLQKYGHSADAIYYFILRNCNLISKFSDFLSGYQTGSVVNNNQ